jgi:hypothetical protein
MLAGLCSTLSLRSRWCSGRKLTPELETQVALAMALEEAGADVIQTEGGKPMKPSSGGACL